MAFFEERSPDRTERPRRSWTRIVPLAALMLAALTLSGVLLLFQDVDGGPSGADSSPLLGLSGPAMAAVGLAAVVAALAAASLLARRGDRRTIERQRQANAQLRAAADAASAASAARSDLLARMSRDVREIAELADAALAPSAAPAQVRASLEGIRRASDRALRLSGDAPEEASPSEGPGWGDLRGRRILLAEDNELNMEIARSLLEAEGIQVVPAVNGQKALEAFTAEPPGAFDGILMDMMMPVMDGLAATRAIRALDRPDAGTVPIFAVTVNVFEEDERRCLEAGMNVHIPKPIDGERLLRTLALYLEPKGPRAADGPAWTRP